MIARALQRAAALVAGLLLGAPAVSAYELPTPENFVLLGEQPDASSHMNYWIFPSSRIPFPHPMPDMTGVLVTRRIDYDGAKCTTPITILDIYQNNQHLPDPDDVAGTRRLTVVFDPAAGRVVVNVWARPYVDGVRANTEFAYSYPLLDPVRFTPVFNNALDAPFSGCVPGRIYPIEATVAFDPYNAIVQLKLAGAATPFVYISPIKIGVGTTIFKNLKSGEFGTVLRGDNVTVSNAAPPPVGIYALYWAYDPDLPGSRVNLMDDFNLNFGAKAFPVPSPTLRAGTAAPAVITTLWWR
ncbi:hypothetical protein ACETK8_20405 (plasmid) [Brevundimonas staleyi]|uniref:Uncharacterized protein n=1 Tax=Brevundimonas staleyi TaxID=74326 RepID=A0ABW0FQF8_9CAUL